jgi:hypothetical protein
MSNPRKQTAIVRPSANAMVFDMTTTGEDRYENTMTALIELERESEKLAGIEELQKRNRAVVYDHCRVQLRAKELAGQAAPQRLTPSQLKAWQEFDSHTLVPGPAMMRGINAERRLAPEISGSIGDDRIHFILQKHVGIPLGEAGQLVLSHYWEALDIAAESVEQTAFPGTDEARKRYALAMRRFARELRQAFAKGNREEAEKFRRQAIGTVRLAIDDGTLKLWRNCQALVDFVGRCSDGSSQDANTVSNAAWRFIWEYAVVSRLRQSRPQCFASVPDLRRYRADEEGRLLDAAGRPIKWCWNGNGSGMLESDAAPNEPFERLFAASMSESGFDKVLARPDWTNNYEQSTEHLEFCRKMAVAESITGAAPCEAIAEILEADLKGATVDDKQQTSPALPNLQQLVSQFRSGMGFRFPGGIRPWPLADAMERLPIFKGRSIRSTGQNLMNAARASGASPVVLSPIEKVTVADDPLEEIQRNLNAIDASLVLLDQLSQATSAATSAVSLATGTGNHVTPKRITWQEAQKAAENHCARNSFPGVNALMKLVRETTGRTCSKTTIRKAIDRSTKLRAMAAEYQDGKSVSARAITPQVAASAKQARERDPAEAVSTDEIFDALLEQATPAERAELHAKDSAQRRELVEAMDQDAIRQLFNPLSQQVVATGRNRGKR